MTPVALTIAGSDSGGGAGIQADLKTFAAFGVFGASAITAVTAQNSRSVDAVHVIPPEMVAAQIEAVFEDLPVEAVKIGMLGTAGIIAAIGNSLARHGAGWIVLDPVLVATSGARLLPDSALDVLVEVLLPKVHLLTPNLPEAAALTGLPIATNEAEVIVQGEALLAMGPQAVLIKGGHASGPRSTDLLIEANSVTRFSAQRQGVGKIHGGGCMFSAAITAGLARGWPLIAAVRHAKRFVSRAIAAAPSHALGSGARLLHPTRRTGARFGHDAAAPAGSIHKPPFLA